MKKSPLKRMTPLKAKTPLKSYRGLNGLKPINKDTVIYARPNSPHYHLDRNCLMLSGEAFENYGYKRINLADIKKRHLFPCACAFKNELRKTLKLVSPKQAKENALWAKIKAERIMKLLEKFGILKCESCLKPIYCYESVDAHHADRKHDHNNSENCRIVHRVCHDLITDNKVKDVPSLL